MPLEKTDTTKERGRASKITRSARKDLLKNALEMVGVRPADFLPHRNQLRRSSASEALEELATSIRTHGIIEPLIARRTAEGLELVCGHRRLAASQHAGLREVPVIIRDIPDDDVILLAIHENLHRDGMSPIEEAEAYRTLLACGRAKSQGALAKLVGVTQGRISQVLALLDLPHAIQALIGIPTTAGGRTLTEPHARLLRLIQDPATQLELAREVSEQNLSVQDLKERIEAGRTSSNLANLDPNPTRRTRWSIVERARYRRTHRGISLEVEGATPEELGKNLAPLITELERTGLLLPIQGRVAGKSNSVKKGQGT